MKIHPIDRTGDQVLSEGERVSRVCIAIAGTIEIHRQGQRLATVKPGHIIGTALALTNAPSPISASFADAGRYIQWPVSQLRVFLDQHPDLRLTLQRHVNQDLARKLEAAMSLGSTTN